MACHSLSATCQRAHMKKNVALFVEQWSFYIRIERRAQETRTLSALSPERHSNKFGTWPAYWRRRVHREELSAPERLEPNISVVLMGILELNTAFACHLKIEGYSLAILLTYSPPSCYLPVGSGGEVRTNPGSAARAPITTARMQTDLPA